MDWKRLSNSIKINWIETLIIYKNMKLMYLYCSPQSHHLSLSYQCVSITGSQSVVTCPRLDAPTGGKLTCSGPETGPVPAGTQCTLACKKGYLRQGNSQRLVVCYWFSPFSIMLDSKLNEAIWTSSIFFTRCIHFRSCMDTGEWDNGVGWCQVS